METLEALAVRCEGASGPDRELDEDIWQAVTGKCPHRNLRAVSGDADCFMEICDDCREEEPDFDVPPYTASLDAAMTLVPTGKGTIYKRGSLNGWWRVQIYTFDKRLYSTGDARTEALAVTAAALRAHLLAQKDHTPS